MLCENQPLQMLDTFIPGIPDDVNRESRAKFIEFVETRLARIDPDFALRLRAEWDRLGDSNNWPLPVKETWYSGDEFLSFDTNQFKNCSIVQVASFVEGEWISRKSELYYPLLASYQKRILELHESLYIIGVRDFNHNTPIRTRKLILALLSSGDASLTERLSLFKLKHIFRPGREISRHYRMNVELSENVERCPMHFEVRFIDLYQVQMLIDGFSSISYNDGWRIHFEGGLNRSRFGHETFLCLGSNSKKARALRFESPDLDFSLNLTLDSREIESDRVILSWHQKAGTPILCTYDRKYSDRM